MGVKQRRIRKQSDGRVSAAAPAWGDLDHRLRSIIELSSSFYWETDEQYRFTMYLHRDLEAQGVDPLRILGKASRELGGVPVDDDGNWGPHIAVLDARQPFYNFLTRYPLPGGSLMYVSSSGQPMFDAQGRFRGYRGIARNATSEMRGEVLLRLEQTVMHDLAQCEDVADGLTRAIRTVCESEGWQAGTYWKCDEPAGVLRYELGWSISDNPGVLWAAEQARKISFEPGQGLPGWVWQTGELLWVPDVSGDPRIDAGVAREVNRSTGWNAAILFPVTSEGKVIGVVDFYAPRIPEPDERLLQVIRVLGTELGHFYRRNLALEQLRDSEERFRSLTQLTSDWYWEQDAESRFTRFEAQDQGFVEEMNRMFIGKRGWETGVEVDLGGRAESMEALMESRQPFREMIMGRDLTDGTRSYFSVSGEPVFDSQGRFRGYRGLSRDVTASKLAEERIQYLATHDGLTGLPNRTVFNQMLNIAVSTARRYQRKVAVLFIDLDGFKDINDTHGHDVGDALLVELASRLKDCLRASDLITRMGGDEFVVLLPEIAEEAQAATVARNVLETVARPVTVSGRDCRITASVGISIYPVHAEDEQSLLKCADTAMYVAKEAGRNTFRFHSGGR